VSQARLSVQNSKLKGHKEVKPPKSKSANQIGLELEMEARRLLQISREMRGKKAPGRKPKDTNSVEYTRMDKPRKVK
jgi:hypothetical protein